MTTTQFKPGSFARIVNGDLPYASATVRHVIDCPPNWKALDGAVYIDLAAAGIVACRPDDLEAVRFDCTRDEALALLRDARENHADPKIRRAAGGFLNVGGKTRRRLAAEIAEAAPELAGAVEAYQHRPPGKPYNEQKIIPLM